MLSSASQSSSLGRGTACRTARTPRNRGIIIRILIRILIPNPTQPDPFPNILITVEKRKPQNSVKCPRREKEQNLGPYAEHTYTLEQIKAALDTGAETAADHLQVGDGNYPHDIKYDQPLEFKCGKDKMDYPILSNNKIYGAGSSSVGFPDRVVFAYVKTDTEFRYWYCGVVRHDLYKGYIPCPAAK